MSPHEFFTILGALSAIATVLYVWLMVQVWPTIETWGQRLRRLCLLYAAGQFTFAASQLATDPTAQIHFRSLTAGIFAVLLIVTALVSLADLRRKPSA